MEHEFVPLIKGDEFASYISYRKRVGFVYLPPSFTNGGINTRERYIPPFIMLIAAAITSIINIINQVEVVTALKRLLLVIIIFYIFGLIVKAVIKMALTKFAKKEQTEEKQEEE